MSELPIGLAIREDYESIQRKRLTRNESVAVLHMSARQTAIALGHLDEPDGIVVMDIGPAELSSRHFLHTLPTALDLENSIAVVEDEIARVRDVDGTRHTLSTLDSGVRDIALLAGVGNQSPLEMHIAAVEGMFVRMASVAEGQPASFAGIPPDKAFWATLLILRELMHHLHFTKILCV